MDLNTLKHGRLVKWGWILPLFVGILIAVHGIVLYRLFSHMTGTVVLGLVLLLLLKHLGVLGPIYMFVKRRFRH